MFVIDEDKDDDNSRGDDDGVNTSEARIGPGGRGDHPRYAPRGIQLHMYGQEDDRCFNAKCSWVLLEMMSLEMKKSS